MNNKVSLVLADDHEIFLTGLARTVRKISFVNKICTAQNGNEILALLDNLSIQGVMLNIRIRDINGMQIIKKIRAKFPAIKMIGLSNFNDPSAISAFMNAGGNGLLLKNATAAEVEEALYWVLDGKIYFSSQVRESLNTHAWEDEEIYPDRISILKSKWVRELLFLICRELTTKEIADHLNLSEKTVEKYRADLMRATGAKNMVGLALFALKNNIESDDYLLQKYAI